MQTNPLIKKVLIKMKNQPLPINGKKLAARWGIETVDLLYIMLNHGLNVVDPLYDRSGHWRHFRRF